MSLNISADEAARLRTLMLGGLAPGERVAHVMAGIPGAGKSTFVAMAQADGRFPRAAFILDPDRIMTALEPYQADLKAHGAQAAFEHWEMPARALAYEFAHEAASNGLPLIKDMGMSRAENWEMLKSFKTDGYRIYLHHIYYPVAAALRAAAARPRFFPPGQIARRAENLEKLLIQYADVPDEKFCYERAANSFLRIE